MGFLEDTDNTLWSYEEMPIHIYIIPSEISKCMLARKKEKKKKKHQWIIQYQINQAQANQRTILISVH